jgi:hypothetical protein
VQLLNRLVEPPLKEQNNMPIPDFSKLSDEELNAMIAAASPQSSQQPAAPIQPQKSTVEAPSRMEMLGKAASEIPAGLMDVYSGSAGAGRLTSGVKNLYQAIPQPKEAIEMGASMLTQGGPVAVTANIISRYNPIAGFAFQAAKPALMAAAGIFGRWLDGKRTGVEATPGQLVEAGTVAPFIPGSSLALIPERHIAGEAGKIVTATVIAKGLQKGIDTGQTLSPEEAAKIAAEAYGFFKTAQRLSTGNRQRELSGNVNRGSYNTGILNDIIDEGYVIDPSLSNKTSRINKKLVTEGGQSQFQELATQRNMENAAVRAKIDLGINNDLSLSPEVMAQRRETLSGVYRRAGAVSPQAQRTLNELNQARADATSAWTEYSANTRDPSLLSRARNLTNAANDIETRFGTIIDLSGNTALYDEYVAVRPLMSKWHIYNTSLKANGGRGYSNNQLDLGVINAMYDPERGNFTGPLRTMAELANVMPQVSKSRIGQNPVGDKVATLKLMGLNIGSGAGAGIFLGSKLLPTLQMGETSIPGSVAGALAGGLLAQGMKQPIVSALPEFLATKAYQRTMARPSFRTQAPELLPSLLMSSGPSANQPAPRQQ